MKWCWKKQGAMTSRTPPEYATDFLHFAHVMQNEKQSMAFQRHRENCVNFVI